jgi:P2-related tail formation protein
MYNSINIRYIYNGELYEIVLPKYFELINGRIAYADLSINTYVIWDNGFWIVNITLGNTEAIYKNETDSEYPDVGQWIQADENYGTDLEALAVYFDKHTNILASGVSNIEHIAAFDAMVEQRFANLDIEAVLIYLIDTVNASALPSLAAQFDVLGYKGYGLAQTEQQKRDVIKRAIELHRYKGTPWSIKEALKAIGYYNAIIDERLVNPIYYDGIYNHNGSQFYGPGHWADFRIKIDLGNDQGVTSQTASDAVKLILEYKNVRSRLRDVTYMANLTEYVTDVTEELIVNVEVALSDALGYYHNNVYIYGGEITHGTITETLTT